ncbi:MAG: CoB--CoM heterodisulfide reductase iron-sulfur subunit B family protein [Candidatus Marinimicrobia bacterium]|nr:CoB--CoM heterodisulfide reductase iron-sulfur subunit B family protein [Candidatus Neomarinimicrobiota bacterium]
MKVSYYPGCSLHSTGLEYEESTQEVCQLLDIDLVELEDWNCCGAGSAHCTDETLALQLPLRNMVKAEETGLDLVVPCAACYQRFKVAERRIRNGEEQVFDMTYDGKMPIKHLLDFLCETNNINSIQEQVKTPLKGLKPVCYYGCLLTRPPKVTGAEHHENPVMMDNLLTLLGADVRPWSYKTDCCGGSLMLARTDIIVELTGNLIRMAEQAGANCIVTACPLCQANLDTRQATISKKMDKDIYLPSFYFTELLALALGCGESSQWLKRHIVDPRSLLTELSILSEYVK